ncbi:MAG: metallophosphatase family protein [bacterium]|nr:metallophosphatase family protein [bacterium]
MKIAVMSDIHGNMEALNGVLQDASEQKCEQIYFLGDYAMAGPEPIAAVNKIMELSKLANVKLIQGNTDLMIASFTEDLYANLQKKAPVMAESLKNDKEILSVEQKEFLKNLPQTLETEENGIKILLVHGSPRRNNEDILPNTTLEMLEEITSGVDADIILCGHTHIPCGFQTKNKQTVVNVGSVGRPFTENPDSCYLILTISDSKFLCEHRFVSYDIKTASEKLAKRQFCGADKLAKTILNPKERHF